MLSPLLLLPLSSDCDNNPRSFHSIRCSSPAGGRPSTAAAEGSSTSPLGSATAPVPFPKLMRGFAVHALVADPFLLTAWKQVQAYLSAITHR